MSDELRALLAPLLTRDLPSTRVNERLAQLRPLVEALLADSPEFTEAENEALKSTALGRKTIRVVAKLEADRDRYKAALHCCCYVYPCGETCGAHAVEPKLPCNCDPHESPSRPTQTVAATFKNVGRGKPFGAALQEETEQ